MIKGIKFVVNFMFEVGNLAKTPRSFHWMLGNGSQSVAEHTNRVMYIAYVLGMTDKSVDMGRLLQICLFHDLAEARTSDLNYVHQKYVIADEKKAIKDLTQTIFFGKEIVKLLREHKKRISKEAIFAKDADTLEFILSLKEQMDIGNTRAESWIPSTIKRLKTDVAKELAEEILKTSSDEWWFSNKDDEWWVSRNKKVTQKRF